MADFETIYDADATIPGYEIRLGDVLEGNCYNRMPAVIVDLGETRDSTTLEEYEKHGRRVPVATDIEIGCELYQRLKDLPMPVGMQVCGDCPRAQTSETEVSLVGTEGQ